MATLPDFIEPMLAETGTPFDSDKHLFEIKWDGTRCLCFLEGGSYRFVNRRRADMTKRYPEFAWLTQLPGGIVLDGEMVVLREGKSEFALIQTRDHAQTPLKIKSLAQQMPATYVAFDILYDNFVSVMDRPLSERRQLLENRLTPHQRPSFLVSQPIVGSGIAYYNAVVARGLEGVMAKSLTSQYLPGQRSNAWIKIKRSVELICAVVGFLPSGPNDFRSLILAIEEGGKLVCVGKVGTGFDTAMHARINRWLWSHLRDKPILKCPYKGKWVEPGLIMRVTGMARTADGILREPVFVELLKE